MLVERIDDLDERDDREGLEHDDAMEKRFDAIEVAVEAVDVVEARCDDLREGTDVGLKSEKSTSDVRDPTDGKRKDSS